MTWEIDIAAIGGILEGSARIEPGLNAVRASNWQGKSSFVEAVKVGLGVSTALTEGRDRGAVTVETPGDEYAVDLVRTEAGVERRGRPYLTDEYDRIRARLFAAPDETNEIRRAVRRGDTLEEVLLRPLDFQNIDEQIADAKREREQIETELAQAEEASKRLPTVRETVNRLETEVADLRDRRERMDADAPGSEGDAQSALAQARAEREQLTKRIDRLERSVERHEQRLSERRAELADLELVGDPDALEAAYAKARDRRDALKRSVDVLQAVYSATEMVLVEGNLDLVTEVEREIAGDDVICWTCGAEADRETLEDRLDGLGDRLAELRADLEAKRDHVESLEAKREEAAQRKQRRADLEAAIAESEEALADHRDNLATARERRERAERRIEELAADVDEQVAAVADVESEIKYREAELTDARSERESLESRADRVDTLREARDDVEAELKRLRSRKDRITYETREAFDEAIADIVDRFDTGFETARLTSEFDLVVARDGREAHLDALSEGELELLGFVAALAGYEAYDVAETVPIMLVDGVGGLADDNLHTLVEYLRERTEYLVFTVYPEYAAFDGTEISPADWQVATAPEAD